MASRSTESCDSASGASTASRRPVSILLEQVAHFTDNRNETTAAAKSMGGYTMAVSFWMANPPDLSFFSVHCSKPPDSHPKTPDFKVLPHVVGAQGPFVLLRARFFGCWKDEYFMYRAGDGEAPSLEWIAPPDDDNHGSLSRVSEFGILQSGSGSLHYRIFALCDAPSDYQLRIYSSETETWSTSILPNPCPRIKTIVPEKVVRLGGSSLGWVDFSCGLLKCDLTGEVPCVRFIPFPVPLPENRGRLEKASETGVSARWLRDLACVDGMLKFVEIENRFRETEKPVSSDSQFLSDSELIRSLELKNMDEKNKSRVGWRVVIWTRGVWSHCWYKECTFDVADILGDKSTYLPLLSGIMDKSTFKGMYSDFPNLSSERDDILYLRSMAEPSDPNGWVVAVDVRNKTMKALGAFSFEYPDPSKHVFRLCTLSNHLNMSPGTEVSACEKVKQGFSSANNPDNKSVRVDAHISCKSSRVPLPRRAFYEINHARDEAQSIVQNGRVSRDRPASMHIESTRKIRRLVVDLMKRERKEGQGVVQNDHASWVHPDQNNLQRFNRLDGSCGPECGRVDADPILRSYGIYLPHM